MLPWKIPVAFPEESRLQQCRVTQRSLLNVGGISTDFHRTVFHSCGISNVHRPVLRVFLLLFFFLLFSPSHMKVWTLSWGEGRGVRRGVAAKTGIRTRSLLTPC